MIYLIEDKTSRRNDYGWTDKRIEQSKEAICVIDSVTTLLENAEVILSADSVLLYHESFANSVDYGQKKNLDLFLNDVENKGIMIAFFSGSKSQRTMDNRVCNLPPHVMYNNLEHFVKKHLSGDTDFKYLLFGKNPELEDRIREAMIKANSSNVVENKIEISKKTFFYIASDEPLDPPYLDATINDSFDFDCDDTSMSGIVEQDLCIDKYDAIYVPLCFGETLTDFMGLRLALLIRCSKTVNKLTPIVLYGEAAYQDMITNECFDIIKMPGVYYVHSNYSSLADISQFLSDISEAEYNNGLCNVHLNIPSDIGDNHSVANKWAIHRWAHALHISEEMDFDSVEDKVTNSLYFKYLDSLNSFKKTVIANSRDLDIDISNCKSKPKVLLIDDQADEGWYEVLFNILYDENGLDFYYIGDELKQKSGDEIIEIVKDRVSKDSPDIIILDLRLCSSDFGNKPIKDFTGNRVLRAIKHINRGIQVLMFSSTSKVWNYQFLSSKEGNTDGADGFIVKERPEDSKDPFYTRTIIKYFVSNLNQCCKLIYRKGLWEKMQEDIIRCKSSDSEYGKAIAELLELAEESLFAKQTNPPYASIFMNLFRIVEATANQHIDDHPIQDSDGRYYFTFRDGTMLSKFNRNGELINGEVFRTELRSLPYMQKICNTLNYLGAYSNDVYNLVMKRNAFTHPNTSKQNELPDPDVQDVLDVFDLVHGLIQNQPEI